MADGGGIGWGLLFLRPVGDEFNEELEEEPVDDNTATEDGAVEEFCRAGGGEDMLACEEQEGVVLGAGGDVDVVAV